ncbi:hypothetical protein GBAR_LOCUS10099 [Geodia barretti]|uniref:Uncharacterized protein n=1 Tax=Geodia barretti TaxID=519541 RepID=A0AA35WGI7_GEOBA|nr:hypothetical protein GBAR_LOCUS10099 [Geodia barretti]
MAIKGQGRELNGLPECKECLVFLGNPLPSAFPPPQLLSLSLSLSKVAEKLTTNKDVDSDEKEILIEEIRAKTDRAVELENWLKSLNGRIKLLEEILESAEDRNDEQESEVGSSLEKELTEATNSLKERVVSDERRT